MDIIFQHLYDEVYGHLIEKSYRNKIIFPQKFYSSTRNKIQKSTSKHNFNW